jgi:hypothetical protein
MTQALYAHMNNNRKKMTKIKKKESFLLRNILQCKQSTAQHFVHEQRLYVWLNFKGLD